jgi:prepilin-type N-terminal cleavage/methylation domain-containing protein
MQPQRSTSPFGRGFSLVEILVVLVILAILLAVFLPRYLGGRSTTGEAATSAAPLDRARAVECMSNLTQLRQAHTMATTLNETAPASLTELQTQGVTPGMLVCPVGATPYGYDPNSGRIDCPFPGHERH